MPPTVQLDDVPDPTPAWTDLKGFLPGAPGLPAPVRGVPVGAPLAEADAFLKTQIGEGATVGQQTVAGRRVWRVKQFRDFPTVAATVVFDPSGDRVESVQLALPASDGESALVRTWGDADGLVLGEDGQSEYVWQDAAHTYAWKTTPNDPIGRLLVEARTP